jgi:hypothetical protein
LFFLDKTTFNEIQECLSHFRQLISLTLNIRGLSDHLADGYRWETCSTIIHLRKFHFYIEFVNAPIDPNRIFNSFFTPFWREIKQWYVVITTHDIYTISCFNDQLFHAFTSPQLSTSPDDHWFYSKVKRIKIDKDNSSVDLSLFPNLKKLHFSDENIRLDLNSYSHLRHLIFQQSISPEILHNILTHNPRIDHLTLAQIDLHQLLPLKTIHYLQLQDSIKLTNRTQIKQLIRVFPMIKQLFIHLNSIKFICLIINHFPRLENAIFNLPILTKPIPQEWLRENTRLDHEVYSFTCRSEPNRFLIWISNSVSDELAKNID